MLLCYICNGDASCSGTQCVKCNKYIDVNCHGGTVGDGYVVCITCADGSSSTAIAKETCEETIMKCIQKFTKHTIEEVASSRTLKLIFSGEEFSYRHTIYKRGGKEKKNLNDTKLIDLLSEEQSENLFNAVNKIFCINYPQYHDYIFKVLIPETIVSLFAKCHKCSRIKAEFMLNSYLEEQAEKDMEDSSTDGGSGNESDVSTSKTTFADMVKKYLKKYQCEKTARLQKSQQHTASGDESEEDVIPPSPDARKVRKKSFIVPDVWKISQNRSDSVLVDRKYSNNTLRRAEAAAERGFMECVSEEEIDLPGENQAVTNTSRKQHIKKRHQKIFKVKHRLRERRIKESKDRKIKELMKQYLGGEDVVEEVTYGPRRSYVYKCPECKHFCKDKLNRHLILTHKYAIGDALKKQSELRVLYLWCRSEKHNCPLPLLCKECNEWFLRLDHHLIHHKKHKNMTDEEREVFKKEAKETFWQKGCSSTNVHPAPVSRNTSDCHEKQNSEKEVEEEVFVRRSKPDSIKAGPDMESYIPSSAEGLTNELKTKWGVKNEDFFTIYYADAEKLLNGFVDELLSSGMERNLAFQHRNHVELIWSTLSRKMVMFPMHPLANLHLLRDYYHHPTFKMIGKRNGVQASTLRSRYTSLGFFIQFLRKTQVFAGMGRIQLQLLEQSITDFNKDLNPYIRQRKIDVRRDKVNQLLLPSHFVSYGRSRAIQNLLNVFVEYKRSPNGCAKKFTRKFAIQFRDYLITSIVIGNGLRASNIMELRLKDFTEHQVVTGYEGHKVLTNNTYKTSTIYGEKFIVIPDVLYEHYLFYVKHLRNKVNTSKSNKVFLAGAREKMSQANVSASLTASFALANVLKKREYLRVSCTRIRCGIATFACNDGGFETGFFAQHFMKNREATTSLHYNLLSNRRHALNIAMKLYESFSGVNGESINVDGKEVDELVKNFTTTSMNYDKDTVIDWLLKHNADITKKELEDFKYILEDRSYVDFQSNTHTFYGGEKYNNDRLENPVDSVSILVDDFANTGTSEKDSGFVDSNDSSDKKSTLTNEREKYNNDRVGSFTDSESIVVADGADAGTSQKICKLRNARKRKVLKLERKAYPKRKCNTKVYHAVDTIDSCDDETGTDKHERNQTPNYVPSSVWERKDYDQDYEYVPDGDDNDSHRNDGGDNDYHDQSIDDDDDKFKESDVIKGKKYGRKIYLLVAKCCRDLIISQKSISNAYVKSKLLKYKSSSAYRDAIQLGYTKLKFIGLHMQKKYQLTSVSKKSEWAGWFADAHNI